MVFRDIEEHLDVLTDISLEVSTGETLVILGPSGCGKTTLLRILAGFLTPSSGIVHVAGQAVTRPGVSSTMVFQEDATFPWMTVAENVRFASRYQAGAAQLRSNDVVAYLDLFGLGDFATAWPRTLSGGMRKRVELARALASRLPALLLDEPFGSLDVLTKRDMQVGLSRTLEREPRAVVMVTHDIDEALTLGNRIMVMSPRPGRVVEEVILRPRGGEPPHDSSRMRFRERILTAIEG